MNYVFENDFDDDIMKLYERKVVQVMKEKIDKFNNDEVLRDIALKRELAKKTQRSREMEFEEIGYSKGKADGLTEGIDIGHASGLAEGHANGLAEGELKAITEMITSYVQSRFHEDIEEALKELSLSSLQKIKEKIYELDSFEEIKEFIHKV